MKPLADYTQCDLCTSPETLSSTSIQAVVYSSERPFEHEQFTVWQCAHCSCIHALEGVDLDYYYSEYGLHDQGEADAITRFFFGKKLQWLTKAGMTQNHRILDYGCGGGQFLRYLQAMGYTNAHGYDPFTQAFSDTEALDHHYDVVMSSDVLEHDVSVISHLQALIELTTENGFIYIQTPDALGIDLNNVVPHRQVLQQPFHRHVLAHTWIVEQMNQRDWKTTRLARYPFYHSKVPFLNVPAIDHYWETYGGLATLNEKYRWSALLSPKYWYLGLFGSFIYCKDEVQLIFHRKP